MRIGIDIRTLMDERYSGVSEFVFHLLKHLFELDKDNEYVLFYNSYKDLSARLPDFVRDKESVNPGIPNKVFNYVLAKGLGLPKVDRRLGCDVLYLPHFNFTPVEHSPVVQTVHDLSFWRYPETFSLRKKTWHRALDVRSQLKKARLIAAVSESTRQDIIELGKIEPERVRVIYPGLNPLFRGPAPDQDVLARVRERYGLPDKYILYLGTIEPRKNIEGLIEAYGRLSAAAGSAAPFLVLAGGKGWKSGRIYRARELSPYRDRIIFTGYVDDKDKYAIYKQAEIFAYPSFFEGFGFPPLEAMAAGVPVMAGANSSLAEVVGEAGLLVNPCDAAEMAAAMRELLENERLRADCIAKGLAKAAEFDWQKCAESYLGIFKEALG